MTTSNEEKQKEAEYVADGGNNCPVCGSSAITSERLLAEGGEALAKVTCNNCGSKWHDVYQLVSICNLVKGDTA